jgi:flavin reductase (DIM6/NTAB) family NADH-FMN oxidoreductase RutF
MAVDPPEFRRILGHWATGVAIVASVSETGEPRGLTANAIASVSLDPPLVLVCIEHDADTHRSIVDSRVFSVNVLPQAAERLARRFAGNETDDKFVGVAFRAEITGAPVLDEALAWVDCRVRDVHAAGDHTIFVGEVLAGDAREEEPLAYYRGGYGRLAP